MGQSTVVTGNGEVRRRVLHVVPGFQGGGLETWVSRLVREMRASGFDFDVIAPSDAVSETFTRATVPNYLQLLRGPSLMKRRILFLAEVAITLVRRGPYAAVHSHLCAGSAVVVMFARLLGVPATVAHSHIDIRRQKLTPWHRMYRRLAAAYLRGHCGELLACGSGAGKSEFNTGPNSRVRELIGVDESAFSEAGGTQEKFKAQLGIPANACVVAHVGRFEPQKNHRFLIEVFAQTLNLRPEMKLLLIGTGPLENTIRNQIEELGISQAVILLGYRPDAVSILMQVADVFLFPSIYEGLPVALLEAQVAGLNCIISDTIEPGSVVFPTLVSMLSLSAPQEVWAGAVATAANRKRGDWKENLREMHTRGMTIRANAAEVLSMYENQLAKG